MIMTLSGSTLPLQYEPAGMTFVTNRVGDPAAAAHDLGFVWSVDLEDGLRRLTEWRKANMAAVEQRRKKVSDKKHE